VGLLTFWLGTPQGSLFIDKLILLIVVYHVNRRANKTVDHVGNVRLDMEASTV